MTLKKSAPLKIIPSDGFGSFDWKGRPATSGNARSVPILGTSVNYDLQSKSEKEDNGDIIAVPKNWSGIGRPTALPQKMAGLAGRYPGGTFSALKSSSKASLEAKDVWAGLYTLPSGGSIDIGKDTTDGFSGQVADNPDFPDYTLLTHWSRQALELFTGDYIGRELLYIVGVSIQLGVLDFSAVSQGAHETSFEKTLEAVTYILPRGNVITHHHEDSDNTYEFEHNVSRFEEAISKDAAYYASLSSLFQRFSLKCLCLVDTDYPTDFLGIEDPAVSEMFEDAVNLARSALTDVFPDVTFIEFDSSGDTSGLGASAAGIIDGWMSGFYT